MRKASRIVGAVFAALLFAAPARADVFANFGSLEHSIDSMMGQALEMMPPGFHNLRLGLGPVIQPNFPGDNQLFTRLAPVISFRYRNLIEVDNNNIRLNFLNSLTSIGKDSPWSAGPSINIDWGRSTNDSPKLQGIGGISTSFETGVFVAYKTDRVRYRVRIRRDIAGATDGWLADASADYRVVDGQRFYVNVGASTTWTSARWMQVWFGINQNQAAASGLPAYYPHAGMHDISANTSAEYIIDDRWSTLVTFTFARLLSSAADSPLVRYRGSPNQPIAGWFVIYAF